MHAEKDKDNVKYVEMVYDDITQSIDFIESYESTINSIRESVRGKGIALN